MLGKLTAVGVAAFLSGGVTGAAVVTMMAPRVNAPLAATVTAVAVPAPTASVVSLASALVTPSAAPSPSPAETTSASARASAMPPAPSASGGRGDLIREREVLDVARAAIARGQPLDALAATQEHARRWPKGYLSEEREVVLIQALVAAGRQPEAQARAARFRRTFPSSFFGQAVDAAVGSATPAP
jgi:hypothetical protein